MHASARAHTHRNKDFLAMIINVPYDSRCQYDVRNDRDQLKYSFHQAEFDPELFRSELYHK